MASQDITAGVAKVGERLSRSYRRSPQVTLKASSSAVIGIDRLAPHQRIAGQEPACWAVDPEVFFGPADSPAGAPVHAWERRALAVCAGCPVVTACLTEALKFPADDQHGVVGGMTAGQRRAVLRASRRGRGRAPRPRKGGQDVFAPLGGGGRPMRSSGPAATPAARGAPRSPRPARP
ncbi:MAG TPA: WhiB family transcriptional regulator [Pseudonocardiaceae bacterium]|nr:WhiB family transcriptional regulator [Pseudonocardiaceae bacterium]